jgi:hypothetical protein
MPRVPEEPLREIIDAMRTRIQAELDAQIQALSARHDDAVARARQDAEAEADERWGSKVDAVRIEWSARLESEVAAARAEAEERLAAETTRVRTESEERLTSESMRVRSEAEQAIAAERERATAEVDAERRRAEQELQQAFAALDAEREQLEQEARDSPTADVEPTSLVGATRAIGDAQSLSEALDSLVRGAAARAPRAAVFVVNGTRLDEWSVVDIPALTPQPIELDQGGVLRAAVRSGSCVPAVEGDPDRGAPAFARLPAGRSAVAVPLMVGGQAVAVLYADEGIAEGSGAAETGDWSHGCAEAVELLARHAAACLAHLTAVRSLQLLRKGNGDEVAAVPTVGVDGGDRSARRYAKLLISEIKLYNEGAVRVGCQKQDLLQRLHAEIDRARRLYEERVPATVEARQSYFQHELIHTLAGGDPAALGS